MKRDAVIATTSPTARKDRSMNDEIFMKKAIEEAKKAFAEGEVPVGCIIVSDGKIIARSHNRRHAKKSVIDHAEIKAIEKASRKLNRWILDDCDLYSTLEPCMMCSGAIIQARIRRLVFAAKEPKFGCAGSLTNVFSDIVFNHNVEVVKGVLEEESSTLLKQFFQNLRNSKTQSG